MEYLSRPISLTDFPAFKTPTLEYEMPGPVLQFVDLDTFTVGFSAEVFFFSALAVGEGGFGVGDAGSTDAVAV